MENLTRKITYNDNYNCATEAALQILGSKWKGAILYHLLDDKKRFTELQKLLPKVSQRILTLQLRDLEKNKIIVRNVASEIPLKVEYYLDQLGQELKPILLALKKWGEHFLNSTDVTVIPRT